MSKRSRRANRKSSHSTPTTTPRKQTSQAPSPSTPEELFNKGDFGAAERAFRARLAQTPSDDDQRMLFYCLVNLQRYDEAVELSLGGKTPTYRDLLMAGWCRVREERWEAATEFLKESLALDETDDAHYWLARALAAGRYDHKLQQDAETMASVIAHLERAMTLPDCRDDVYLWRADLVEGWEPEQSQKRINYLRCGLLTNPKSDRIRLELSTLLVRLGAPHVDVVEVLSPLLEQAEPPAIALWNAFASAETSEAFSEAAAYVDRMVFCGDGIGAERVKGDLSLKQGQAQAAIDWYDAELAAPRHSEQDALPCIQTCFHRARADLILEKVSDAAQDAKRALDLWFATFGNSATRRVYLHEEEYLRIGPQGQTEVIPYGDTDTIKTVCRALIEANGTAVNLSDILVGQLYYALWEIGTESRNSSVHDDEQRWLLEAAARIDHPEISSDLYDHYAAVGDAVQAVHHYLRNALWEQSTRGQRFYRIEFSCEADSLNKTDRKRVHKAALAHLKECDDRAGIQQVIKPFYKEFWWSLLLDGQMWSETVEAARRFLQVLPDDTCFLFDLAYGLQMSGQDADAERQYRRLIEMEPTNSSALHNLSILLHKSQHLEEALRLSDLSVHLAPKDEICLNFNRKLRLAAQAQAEELKQRDSFLRTAVDRWPQLDRYKRQLLGTLSVIDGFKDMEHLAALSGIEGKYLNGHWRKLVEQGMIIEEGSEFRLNPYIEPLIVRERSHTLMARIVRADQTIAAKPVFNSKLEYTMYKLLVEQFPNLLVFPNMALMAVFSYDRMKELLDSDTFGYYLRSLVDFCVTSTTTYMPLMAFEIDSPYHDNAQQQQRDNMKDQIFRLGGVPLLRLRPLGQPTEEAIRQQITSVLRELGDDLAHAAQKNAVQANLLLEIDFSRFTTALSAPTPVGELSG